MKSFKVRQFLAILMIISHLVSLQCRVVTKLDVDRALPELGHAVGEVVDHGHGAGLLLHLQEGLVLPLQHQHVRHPAEGDAQVDDLRLCHVVGNVSDVDHFARRHLHSVLLLHLEPLSVLIVVVQRHHGAVHRSIVEAVRAMRAVESKLGLRAKSRPGGSAVHCP